MNEPLAHSRKSDHSVVNRAAESATLTLVYRFVVVIAFPVILWMGARFVSQLDANTVALQSTSTQLAITATILSAVERRVVVLEENDRADRRAR